MKSLLPLLAFTFAAIPVSGFSAEGTADFRVRHQGVLSGLSNNTVFAIEEDRFGFLWIGTQNGLNRYDSREWVNYYYSDSDPAGLSNSKVQAILSDRQGRLWIGTAGGLNLYDFQTNSFHLVGTGSAGPALPDQYVRCIFEDSDGDIWVGTAYGLAVFSDPDKECTVVSLGEGGETENNIIDVYEDSQGLLWIGTGEGLFYTRNKKDFFRFDFALHGWSQAQDAQVRSILEVGRTLLIATERSGLLALSGSGGEVQNVRLSEGGDQLDLIFRHLYLDRDSSLWIASTGGLFRLQRGDRHFSGQPDFDFSPERILESSVRRVFEDRNLGLWFGTHYNGLYYHYPDNFLFRNARFDPAGMDGLNNNVVSAFLAEGDSVWIGTDGGGLNLWIRSTDTYRQWTESDGLVNDNIKCLAKDTEGNLWIGTFKGLSIFDGKSFTNLDPGKVNNVLCIHLDQRSGVAWLGTEGSGLLRLVPGRERLPDIRQVSETLSEASMNVNTILPVSDSLLVLGTSGGLYAFSPSDNSFRSIESVLPGGETIVPYIVCLEKDGENSMWAGTERFGILHTDLQQGSTRVLPALNDLPGIMIHAIHQTGVSELWCSTNQGLGHISLDPGRDTLAVTGSVMYTESYGVQSRQFIPRSSYFLDNHELFFGGINGFNYFIPEEIIHIPREITTYVKSLNYWNNREQKITEVPRIFPSGETMVFDHYIRDITLEFIGINYSHPENTRYAYRFSGEGENWIDLGTRNFITFNRLQSGNYHIEIRSSGKSGSWSPGTGLEIAIHPPFWKSGFALALYIIIVLLLLYLFYRTITRWERLRSDLHVEQLRREQEQELHEQRIRFFTDISHELRTPLTLILSPIDVIIRNHSLSLRVRNSLQRVRQNGEKMLQLVNQLLDLRKAETGHLKFRAARGNVVRFLNEVMLSFNDLAQTRNIALNFRADVLTIQTYYDRNKLEIVITNLLSNAIKHTPDGGTVAVVVEEHPDPGDVSLSSFPDGFVQVTIEDTGKGIPPDRLEKIFDRFYEENTGFRGMGIGLELAKKYVELHRGTISVESREEEEEQPGFSRFTIRLPLGRRHLADDQIIEDFVGSEDIKGYTIPETTPGLHPDLEHLLSETAPNGSSSQGSFRLVVVEDNAELREFLHDMLGEQYSVQVAENGKSGWEIILRDPPDLVISDIMMPEMDGMELCRMIKTDVRTSHIPVILLTARSAITFKYEGLETGADEYITKPFHADYLLLKVKNMLYQRDMIRRKYLRESITDPELITMTSVDEKMLKKAIDFIHEHMDQQDLQVETISRHLGMSRVHFYRKMKSLTGVTPREFLRTVRLKYAAKLLNAKQLRISEVAYRCGYRDLSYFSKAFKEFYGVPPSKYGGNPS